MSTRNQWLQGLQWGALVWLPYVAFVACRDCFYSSTDIPYQVELWGRGAWWPGTCWLYAPGWLAVIALLAAGSRWTRALVALLICARVPVAFNQASGSGDSPWQLFVPLLLPLLPLAVLRVEQPRVVLALLALGRLREALARFGGVGTLLVAVAVLSTHDVPREYMRDKELLLLLTTPTAALFVFAAGVMWMEHRRRPTATTSC